MNFSDWGKHHEFFIDVKEFATSRETSYVPTYCHVSFRLPAVGTGMMMWSDWNPRSSRNDRNIRISLVQEVKVKAKWMRSRFWRRTLVFKSGILLGRLWMHVTLWKTWFTKDVVDCVDQLMVWWTLVVTCPSFTRLAEWGNGTDVTGCVTGCVVVQVQN